MIQKYIHILGKITKSNSDIMRYFKLEYSIHLFL
jgi:hypothetical protein